MSQRKPKSKVESPPSLTSEDDALLDKVWDDIAPAEANPTANVDTSPQDIASLGRWLASREEGP